MSTEEEKLLQSAADGNVEAFEKLAGSYFKTVYNIILTSRGRQDDTSVVAQEVFVRVFKHIKSVKNMNSLGSSIYKTTRDICMENPGRARKIS